MRSETKSSVLCISRTDKVSVFLNQILPNTAFTKPDTVSSAAEAKRELIYRSYDIVVINAPLTDEFGTDLAITLTEQFNVAVLLLVPTEAYEHVTEGVEDYGVLTMSRPCPPAQVLHCMRLLAATRARMKVLEEKTESLEKKMEEIRIINQAKGLLMDRYSMTEDEAHKHLTKTAMDSGSKKVDIAKKILQNLM